MPQLFYLRFDIFILSDRILRLRFVIFILSVCISFLDSIYVEVSYFKYWVYVTDFPILI